MYRMKLYSQWGGELKLERILYVKTIAEAFVLAQEKVKVYLGYEKISLNRVRKGRYNIFNKRNFVGELKLLKLKKGAC